MRILITGGAGFIGSHVVDSLTARGDVVLVVDDLSTGKRENVNRAAELVVLDINSPELVDVARGFRPDAISHFAAQPSVVVSMERPVLDARINILGGINVGAAAAACGCAQLIYINTGGALYGVAEYLPIDEDHPIRPISGYGLSKWTLEQYLKILTPPEVALKVLRLSNIYGPRQDPAGEAGVISIFGSRMVRGDPVEIFGDGEQTRDFVYVGDVVRAHEMALATEGRFTVNVSVATGLSVNALFGLMADEAGYSESPVYRPARQGEMPHSVLSNERARRVLGFSPGTSIDDGLKKTLDWLRRGPG